MKQKRQKSSEDASKGVGILEAKQDKLIEALFTTSTLTAAAEQAGYHQTSLYYTIRSPAFAQKIRQYATAHDLLTMPMLHKIEMLCLAEVSRDPKQYPKYKEIFRQKKQIAGLLAQDTSPPADHGISIGVIERLQVIIGGSLGAQDYEEHQAPECTKKRIVREISELPEATTSDNV